MEEETEEKASQESLNKFQGAEYISPTGEVRLELRREEISVDAGHYVGTINIKHLPELIEGLRQIHIVIKTARGEANE